MRSVRAILSMATGVTLVAAAPVALAHAAYKSSDPGDGSTVASPPSRVTAEFTEPLTGSSSMQVFDPCGNQVDQGDSNVSGYEMSVSMSADSAGTYVVDFTAQSALDSHTTRGSFSFTSSGGESCGDTAPTQPPSGGGGGDAGGSRGGGGSGDGAAAPQDPAAPAGPAQSGSGGGGPAGGASTGRGRTRSPSRGGSGDTGPVAFQNTGDQAPAEEPAPWDLPVDGVVIALVLCVMIGAAGGRVYAGIVAPPRR